MGGGEKSERRRNDGRNAEARKRRGRPYTADVGERKTAEPIYAVTVNGDISQAVDYHPEGRSEEWEVDVLTNHATRATTHRTDNTRSTFVTLTAIDEGGVIDQITVHMTH